MSDKWDDNQEPVLNVGKPEEEPAGRRPRITLIVLGIVFILTLAISGSLWLRSGNEDTPAKSTAGTDAGTDAETADTAAESATAVATMGATVTIAITKAATAAATETATQAAPTEVQDPTESPVAAENLDSLEGPSPAESPESTVPSYPGRIAYINPDNKLGTVSPDGSQPRLLTGEGQNYKFPAWSPAGDTIAAIGQDSDGGGIYVTNDQENSEVNQLYADREKTPIYLYWTPDGQQVSFITSHPDGMALQLVPADASGANRVVATGGPTFFWHWAPDGNRALIHTGFTARPADDTRLAFVSLDQEDDHEVPQSGFYQAPGISADGRYYAFGDADPLGRHWLSISNIVNNQQERLVGHEGVVAMDWSPTQNQLAYTSPGSPVNSFYGPLTLLDMDSGELDTLVPETVLAFFWAPDGRSIAYLTFNRIREENKDTEKAQLSPGLAFDTSGSNSRENRKGSDKRLSKRQPQQPRRIFLNLSVIELAGKESDLLLTFEPTHEFMGQFLPFFDQYNLSHRLWSPDSQAIVLPLQSETDEQQIVVIPVDGGKVEVVAQGSVAFWSLR